jgi:hypothetical protein
MQLRSPISVGFFEGLNGRLAEPSGSELAQANVDDFDDRVAEAPPRHLSASRCKKSLQSLMLLLVATSTSGVMIHAFDPVNAQQTRRVSRQSQEKSRMDHGGAG